MLRALVLTAALAVAGAAHAGPITVDNCGTPLTFDRVPERMVVHDINMSEMAFALGLQDRMVGVTGITGWYETSPEFDARRGDIPELAPKYPTLENLLSVDADLFFAGWYYGMRPGGDVTPDTLAPLGIDTLVLTESCIHSNEDQPAASMELLFRDVERLGVIFGKSDAAARLVAGWRERLEAIRQKVGERTGTRVFLYDSGDDKPFTAGKYAIVNAMIEAAGGVNVTGDMETSWGRASWEAVAAADPEFLILLDYRTGAGAPALLSFLERHPAMSEVDAVRNRRFVMLRYEELTPGPANVGAIDKIASAMYPDLF